MVVDKLGGGSARVWQHSLLACTLFPTEEVSAGRILGRVLSLPLLLLVCWLWNRRSKAPKAPKAPVRPIESPQPGSGGRLTAGMSSHGPDGVVANFRIECPVDGSNVVFSTVEAANAWLQDHKLRCRFHAGMLPEARVACEPISGMMAWNMSKWASRWWWHEPLREWHWIESEWMHYSEVSSEGLPPRKLLVNRLSGTERPIVSGGAR